MAPKKLVKIAHSASRDPKGRFARGIVCGHKAGGAKMMQAAQKAMEGCNQGVLDRPEVI